RHLAGDAGAGAARSGAAAGLPGGVLHRRRRVCHLCLHRTADPRRVPWRRGHRVGRDGGAGRGRGSGQPVR
nr:hypothetical protein [Tanacetum cinerariifolium]